jgi:hypothetical protein
MQCSYLVKNKSNIFECIANPEYGTTLDLTEQEVENFCLANNGFFTCPKFQTYYVYLTNTMAEHALKEILPNKNAFTDS